jgi:hypothetical protein
MTREEQNLRLADAYQKMTPQGRDVLDKLVKQLETAHINLIKRNKTAVSAKSRTPGERS